MDTRPIVFKERLIVRFQKEKAKKILKINSVESRTARSADLVLPERLQK